MGVLISIGSAVAMIRLMTWKMNLKPAWACALSSFILAETAHAQSPPGWVPQQYLVHISIQAAPSTELEVVPSGGSAEAGSPAVARCTAYCDFWALPGRYTLYLRDHSTGVRKDLGLRIKQSSRFELQAGDDDARSAGLALGIAGSAAILAGFVLMMPVVMSSMCHDTNCTSQGERDAATAGVGLLLAGAITTPIGWIMYASNRTRLKRMDEGAYRAKGTNVQVRLGVVGVGMGGLGLGGVATF
jgi:hypothetical protein